MEKGRCVGWPFLIRGRQPPLPRPPRLIQARGARGAGNSGLLGDPWMRRATQGGRARGVDEQQPLPMTSSAPTLTLNPAQLCSLFVDEVHKLMARDAHDLSSVGGTSSSSQQRLRHIPPQLCQRFGIQGTAERAGQMKMLARKAARFRSIYVTSYMDFLHVYALKIREFDSRLINNGRHGEWAPMSIYYWYGLW